MNEYLACFNSPSGYPSKFACETYSADEGCYKV